MGTVCQTIGRRRPGGLLLLQKHLEAGTLPVTDLPELALPSLPGSKPAGGVDRPVAGARTGPAAGASVARTASAPPGQKSFWTSTTRRTSASPGLIASLMLSSCPAMPPTTFRHHDPLACQGPQRLSRQPPQGPQQTAVLQIRLHDRTGGLSSNRERGGANGPSPRRSRHGS